MQDKTNRIPYKPLAEFKGELTWQNSKEHGESSLSSWHSQSTLWLLHSACSELEALSLLKK